MYVIDPYRPVHMIVADLKSRPEANLKMALGRSVARAIHKDDPDALLVLALAYCVSCDTRLHGDTLADMVEVMNNCGATGL